MRKSGPWRTVLRFECLSKKKPVRQGAPNKSNRAMIETTASSKHFLGMPAGQFLRDYWQKKPLLIRRAFPNYQAPLTPEDLAGLACEEGVLARLVRHDRKTDHWSVTSGPFPESEFPKLPRKDWTLLVQDMDKWDADVRALLDRFDFLPRWRLDDIMISFAAPGGSVGPHVDQYDVFLLQAQGRRRWQIDTDPQAPRDFREDAELKLLKKFTPSHEWLLEPGDMLYLPPGVPHHGEAVDACLTFSVGMRAPSHAELLSDWADSLLEHLPEDLRYADDDLKSPKDSGEIDAAACERVLEIFRRHVPDSREAAAAFFGRFITTYRNAVDIAAPPRPPSPEKIERQLAKGARLESHPYARWAWSRDGKDGIVFVQGQAFATTPEIASRLASGRAIDADDYRRIPPEQRVLLHVLTERGYLLLSTPAKGR
jgi:50S ribosomal protein L16 3-hydroxylase